MKRKAYDKLVKWFEQDERLPLLVEGARQVGKTYLINEFANKMYEKVIKINLLVDDEGAQLFERNISSKVLEEKISALYNCLNDGVRTLLFLDEVQACPNAITALKSLSEIKNLDCIATGSLLGIGYRHVKSFPVGYVDRFTLYPMDFEEFMMAIDKSKLYEWSSNIHSDPKINEPFYHNMLLDFYTKYALIGGMPAVVKCFVNTNDYSKVFEVQSKILSDYKDDIAKYATAHEKIKVREVFDSIPMQLAKENKKFQYNIVREGGRASLFESSIQWLIDAGIVYKSYEIKNLEIPINAYVVFDKFKIFLLDVGLLVSMYGIEAQTALMNNKLLIAKGGIYESLVATAFKKMGIPLFYFTDNNRYEIDFIIEKNLKVYAVEVKSSDNTKSKSLNAVLEKFKDVDAYRISTKQVGRGERITSVPIYNVDKIK